MMRLENFVNQMSPLIDSELERVDRKHAQLTQLSSDLIDTINLYHSLMRDTEPMRMPNNNFSTMPGRQQFYPTNGSYGMQSQQPQHMGMPSDQMNSGFSQMAPENYHLMHSQASNMQHLNQNSSLPPNEQMMQQQFSHQPHPTMMGQMQQIPGGVYQVPPPQEVHQASGVQQQQNHQTFPHNPNLAQNFSLPPMQQQQNRMVVPPNFPMTGQMTSNQMMQLNQQQQHMQLNDMGSMMANMNLHSMPMNYPLQQVDASSVPMYQQQQP